jgi:hypothetical protein
MRRAAVPYTWLGRLGYRNNKTERTIEIDPVDSPIVIRMMEAYTGGAHTLSTLQKLLKSNSAGS